MNSILYFLRQSPGLVALAVVAGLLSGASNIGLLTLINRSIYQHGPSATSLIWSFSAICLLFMACRFISQLVLNNLSKQTMVNLQMHLSQRILATPLRHLEEIGSHRLMSAITQDVASLTAVSIVLPGFCLDFAIVVGCVAYLGWLSWHIQLMVIAFVIAGVGIYKIIAKYPTRILTIMRQEENIFFRHLQTLVEGIKELKLNRQRRIGHFLNAFHISAASLRRHAQQVAIIFAGAASWAVLVFYALIGMLIFAIPAQYRVDTKVITGSLLAILFLRAHIEGMMNAFNTFATASVALHNLEALDLADPDHGEKYSDGSAGDFSVKPWSHLELDGVTHSYPAEEGSGRFVLGPLNLAFQPGNIVFISGGNGSGKTTFIKLLVGLYAPESGEIRLNHQHVHDGIREQYRQHFSALFSDYFLFDELVCPYADEGDITARDYLALLQLGHKVQVTNGILSTTRLSQGQRKRLALLIAYMEDRQIYVFDEWAADQDPAFRETFYRELLPALKARHKTVFVISHDDRYYHLADRLIKLEYGHVERDYTAASLNAALSENSDAKTLGSLV